jgi:hypothetical protein
MSSLWEIADPSNLKYDTVNRVTRDDSGDGPPTGIRGWIRTGYVDDHSMMAGRANRDTWTSLSGEGTTARLPTQWNAGLEDLGVWELSYRECNLGEYVWCVED